MPTSPTSRAALYARVSTTHHGQDLGLQLDALREVVAARGWIVVEEFVDEGISGTKTTRPGLDAMLAACRVCTVVGTSPTKASEPTPLTLLVTITCEA